jgi:hypothetical protein
MQSSIAENAVCLEAQDVQNVSSSPRMIVRIILVSSFDKRADMCQPFESWVKLSRDMLNCILVTFVMVAARRGTLLAFIVQQYVLAIFFIAERNKPHLAYIYNR